MGRGSVIAVILEFIELGMCYYITFTFQRYTFMKQFLFFGLSVWLSGFCTAAELLVVTSIRPLALLAGEILGDDGRVESILPGNTSPHHYALKVSDMARLQKADLVLWVGPALERFLVKPLQTVAEERRLSLAATETLKQSIEGAGKDPHIWLSPRNGILLAGAIAEQLSLTAPASAEIFRQRAKDLITRLHRLDDQLQRRFATLTEKGFGVYHNGYSHFVQAYGLHQIVAVTETPERPPGARHLYEVRRQLGQKNANCLFIEPYYRSKAAENLAAELGLPLLSLDPLGMEATTYEGLLNQLAEGFSKCLSE